VRHAAFMFRCIDVPQFRAVVACSYEHHVQARFDLGEQDMALIQPCEPRGVGKKQARLAS